LGREGQEEGREGRRQRKIIVREEGGKVEEGGEMGMGEELGRKSRVGNGVRDMAGWRQIAGCGQKKEKTGWGVWTFFGSGTWSSYWGGRTMRCPVKIPS